MHQFVQDLHTGKLHREFHNGPDPSTEAPESSKSDEEVKVNTEHVPKMPDPSEHDQKREKPSTPPDSVFIKLAPSRDRYSLKNDEL